MLDSAPALSSTRAAEDLDLAGPVVLPFRSPPPEGTPYRLVVEYAGDQRISESGGTGQASTLSESHLLELEYRELPVEGSADSYRVALDGLHYRLVQGEPEAEREIELWNDRLRTLADREVVMDLRGAQPKGDLTPRKVLQRVFGVVEHDGRGNVRAVRSQGSAVARRFLSELPLRQALAYARPGLPSGPAGPGTRWSAVRYPIGPAGDLGLPLDVEFTLAGFQRFGGVPCAWLVLLAETDAEEVRSAKGFAFDRVRASLRGEAWIEIDTSRIRFLRLEDEIRASYTRWPRPDTEAIHLLRHRTRLLLELREGAEETDAWADGTERFAPR